MTVAKKIRDTLIVKPARTVTDLAQALGMSRPAISNVLNGNADLSIELAIKLETTYGLNAKRLLYSQLDERLAQARAKTTGDKDE